MAALGGHLVMARATQGTIAGIGLQEVAGKKEPRIWTALLDQFAVTFQNEEATVDTTDTSGAHVDTVWEIMDPAWHGCLSQTLPADEHTDGLDYGLIDNVVIVDKNTMITAIYTDCTSSSATACLGVDFSMGYMHNKQTNFMTVLFTLVCTNVPVKREPHTTAEAWTGGYSGKDFKAVFPPPRSQETLYHMKLSADNVENFSGGANAFFSGRITHVQSVGDDLLAINYQMSSAVRIPGVVSKLKQHCQQIGHH